MGTEISNDQLIDLSPSNLVDLLDLCCTNLIYTPFCATVMCFEVLKKISMTFQSDFVRNIEANDLRKLEEIIRKLNDQRRFLPDVFVNEIFKSVSSIPEFLAWWLHKMDIFYILNSFFESKVSDLPNKVCALLNREFGDVPRGIDERDIGVDYLSQLVIGSYSMHAVEMERLKASCTAVLKEIIQFSLERTRSSQSDLLVCLEVIITNKKLNKEIVDAFIQDIVHVALHFQPKPLLDVYQQQTNYFGSNLPKAETRFFKEIVKRIDVSLVFDKATKAVSNKDDLDWSYFLIFVTCVSDGSNCQSVLKEFVNDRMQKALTRSSFEEFVLLILTIRQYSNYENWYRNTFGINSDSKIHNNVGISKFVIECLMKLVPFEPKEFLKVHIERNIKVPPKNQELFLHFKSMSYVAYEEHSKITKV